MKIESSLTNTLLSVLPEQIRSPLVIRIVLVAAVVLAAVAALAIFLYQKFSFTATPLQDPLSEPPIKAEHLTPKQIEKLAAAEIKDGATFDKWAIINTGMTALLANDVYGHPTSFDETNKLIKKLVSEALDQHNPSARLALTQPNNPDQKVIDSAKVGFPQNNPLALLIKAKNAEGALTILPVCEKQDLQFTTPRENSALHLAVVTGQLGIAIAILKRGKQLGIDDYLLAMQNIAGKTADDLLHLFTDKDLVFKNFLDVVNPHLGGEEINKARARPESILQGRQLMIAELTKIRPDFKLSDLKKLQLKDLSS